LCKDAGTVIHSEEVAASQRVHITRDRNYGGKRRSVVVVHCAPLADIDVIRLEGMHLTSLARTVLDLARSWPFEQAVAASDRAMAIGLRRFRLDEDLLRMERWPNVRQARRVVAFLDGRSESVGESLSRIPMADDGLPRARR
jgi:hypothetical protein